MNISLTKHNFFVQLISLTLILGGIGAVFLQYVLPRLYFEGYPFIPVYFFLFGVFEISMFDACRKNMPKRLVFFYLAVKMMKLVFSVLFLVVYCIAIHKDVKAFLLTFIVYYIVYLVHETWFFVVYETAKKNQKEKDKNETIA